MAYKPYRGTRKKRRGRLLLALIPLVLILLGAAAFLILGEYIVFTAQGFRLELPFAPSADPQPLPAEEPDQPPAVIIEGDPPATTQPPATTAPAPEKRPGLTRAVLVDAHLYPGGDLPPGAEHRALCLLGADGLAQARLPAEVDPEGTPQQLALSQALSQSGDVAVISVFRNHAGAAADRSSAAVVASGKTWLDAGLNRWLSPYAPGAGETAAALLGDCARLGLSEVVLDAFQFPTQGRLELIDWGREHTAESRRQAITGQAADLRQAFDQLEEGAEMLLACLLTPTAARQLSDEAAGQNAALLAQYFDILYVPTDDPDFDTAPLYAALEGTGCRVGLWLTAESLPDRPMDIILAP